MRDYTFYVYILSNLGRSSFYIGFTSSLTRRLREHYFNRGKFKTFAGRYYCYYLVYYEIFQYVNNAIAREKQLKRWNRQKKLNLIKSYNPKLNRLNKEFFIPEDFT